MKPTPSKNCTTCKFIFFHQEPIENDLFEEANRCEHPVKPIKNRVIDENWVCRRFEAQQIDHETCDGCQMFQDCGCMLDVSVCPDCFEHNMWTPKK